MEEGGNRMKRRGVQVRGEALVEQVLKVALDELGEGFEAFSVEAVARRAKVNKTTLYRRWPTREELALDALKRTTLLDLELADQGSLEADLTQFLKQTRDLFERPQIDWLFRLWFSKSAEAEFKRILPVLRDELRKVGLCVFERGVQRGELPPDTDVEFAYDALLGSCIHLIFRLGKGSDENLSQLRALVLHGVVAQPARTRRR
jgi:AcrR family transcriptional regulator